MRYQALATDFDGTLAHDGHVDDETLAAVRKLKASGRRLILVTGRELIELQETFADFALCDAIVAENGALLYWPDRDETRTLGERPPERFVLEAHRRGVAPYSIGQVIFATWRPHESTILEIIQELGIEYQIIFNKDAVMVLPSGINKAAGLAEVLREQGIAAERVVGVGDAENDHAFLDACGCAAAVDNALPSLKEKCDLVTAGSRGAGVIELIDRLLADDLQSLGLRRPRAVNGAQAHPGSQTGSKGQAE